MAAGATATTGCWGRRCCRCCRAWRRWRTCGPSCTRASTCRTGSGRRACRWRTPAPPRPSPAPSVPLFSTFLSLHAPLAHLGPPEHGRRWRPPANVLPAVQSPQETRLRLLVQGARRRRCGRPSGRRRSHTRGCRRPPLPPNRMAPHRAACCSPTLTRRSPTAMQVSGACGLCPCFHVTCCIAALSSTCHCLIHWAM